jgi:hypothetical protein
MCVYRIAIEIAFSRASTWMDVFTIMVRDDG